MRAVRRVRRVLEKRQEHKPGEDSACQSQTARPLAPQGDPAPEVCRDEAEDAADGGTVEPRRQKEPSLLLSTAKDRVVGVLPVVCPFFELDRPVQYRLPECETEEPGEEPGEETCQESPAEAG